MSDDDRLPEDIGHIRPDGRLELNVPDVYVTRQARAAMAALADGDPHRAAGIINHLQTEGGMDPQDILITLYFKASTDAITAGDTAKAQRIQDMMVAQFEPAAIRAHLARTLLITGAAAGLMDATRYDQLKALMKDTGQGPEAWAMFAKIVRVDDEEGGS